MYVHLAIHIHILHTKPTIKVPTNNNISPERKNKNWSLLLQFCQSYIDRCHMAFGPDYTITSIAKSYVTCASL